MDIITTILGVWEDLVGWFTTTLGTVGSVFYGADGLTFIGALAILGVALSVGMLIFNIVKDFLKMRA